MQHTHTDTRICTIIQEKSILSLFLASPKNIFPLVYELNLGLCTLWTHQVNTGALTCVLSFWLFFFKTERYYIAQDVFKIIILLPNQLELQTCAATPGKTFL